MKKVLVALIILIPLLITIAYSHSGRTDSAGGHYDRSTGEYHYHHGYPAHQHPNGICPYETPIEVSPTSPQSNTTTKTYTNTTTTKNDNSNEDNSLLIIFLACIGVFASHILIKNIIEIIKEVKKRKNNGN